MAALTDRKIKEALEGTKADRLAELLELPHLKPPVYHKEPETHGLISTDCTTWYSYKLKGLKVELNKIDYLGLIVEIEALTNNKSKISSLEKNIRKTMKELQLKELDPNEYQRMMDVMYSKTLKPLPKHTFQSLK